MPKNAKINPARDRVIYEITIRGNVRRVEATRTAELRDQLAVVLPEVEQYALQAAARLASIERANISTAQWSIRRVGILAFQADEVPVGRAVPKARRERVKAEELVIRSTSESLLDLLDLQENGDPRLFSSAKDDDPRSHPENSHDGGVSGRAS